MPSNHESKSQTIEVHDDDGEVGDDMHDYHDLVNHLFAQWFGKSDKAAD